MSDEINKANADIPTDILAFVAHVEACVSVPLSIDEANVVIYEQLPKLLAIVRAQHCNHAFTMREWEHDATRANAAETELEVLRSRIATLEPDAKAWRDGVEVLRELQARVMPCGHEMENLIRVGKHDVTTCGACLAAKQAAANPKDEKQ